jgi:transglutaminase-like putative cysteine protease
MAWEEFMRNSIKIALQLLSIASASWPLSGGAAEAEPLGRRMVQIEARIEEDLTFSKRVHLEATTKTAAAVEAVSRVPLLWTDRQKLEVIEAYTRKADGSIVAANPADFVTQDGIAGAAASFADVKIKQIAFRDVAAGDTVVLIWRVSERDHYMPGLVWEFLPVTPVNFEQDIAYKLDTPANLAIKHSEREMTYRESPDGEHLRREWSGAFLHPPAAEQNVVDVIDRVPSLEFSTFQSYERLGEAYYGGIAEKNAPTAKTRALAEEITNGLQDPRAQARAIFDWITKNIHYVAINLGLGRIFPNDLDTILARRFGDCKDQALLMAALLKVKGIDSEQVLINAQRSSRLLEAPTLAAFNHVILYVPSLDAYVDPTVRTATFDALPSQDMDSPVVRASAKGAVVARTPVGSADQNQLVLDTDVKIAASGAREGQSKISATGAFARQLRDFSALAETQGQEAALQAIAKQQGFRGEFALSAPSPTDHAEPYELRASWKRDEAPSIVLRGWRAPAGLSPVWASPEAFFGPVGMEKRRFPAGCAPGRIRQTVRVELPDGVRPKDIPDDVKFIKDDFSFSRHWGFSNAVLSVETEMSSTAPTRICSADYVNAVMTALADRSEAIDPILHFAREAAAAE